MIDILLATYNGAAFLEEQIDSLLDQEFREWRLLVRDDGSSDETVEILERYAARFGDKIAILPNGGVRLGAAGSFAELMRLSEAPYLMLCDQDDLWLPRKIGVTLEKMKELEAVHGDDRPLLVHADFTVVDETLNVLADSGWRYQKTDPERATLNRLLVQNVATGCTFMINRALRNLALPIPAGAMMHDWWLMLVAAGFGRIGYLADSLLLYRQHGVNTVGAKGWSALSFLRQVRSLGEVREAFLKIQRQADLFYRNYGETLSPEDGRMVQAFSRLAEKGFFLKRYLLIRYGFFHAGVLRKFGMLLLG